MGAVSEPGVTPAAGDPPRKRRKAYGKLPEATDDAAARRLCAVILEVLGGARTPTDAAGALGISAARYYVLEARGLRGLLKACQRRGKGRRRSAESELLRMRGELRRVESERDRLGALLRASQRTLGLGPPAKAPAKAGPARDGARPSGPKRRARRAQVRALRAARSLEASTVSVEVSPSAASSPPGSCGASGAPASPHTKKPLEATSSRRDNASGVKA